MSPLLMVESGEIDETLSVDVKVDKTRSPVFVQALVPAATLTFTPKPGTGELTAGLTLIVRTLNRDGLTLALTSRTFAINARPGELERARQKAISFETTIEWRKDARALDVIAYDVAGRRVGVRRVR
jgi:hypothetical protein